MIANLHSTELINIREDMKVFEPEIQKLQFFHSGNSGDKPYNYNRIVDYAKKKFDACLLDTSKIAIIGNRLFEDIIFGNLNKMSTVFVSGLNNIKMAGVHKNED